MGTIAVDTVGAQQSEVWLQVLLSAAQLPIAMQEQLTEVMPTAARNTAHMIPAAVPTLGMTADVIPVPNGSQK